MAQVQEEVSFSPQSNKPDNVPVTPSSHSDQDNVPVTPSNHSTQDSDEFHDAEEDVQLQTNSSNNVPVQNSESEPLEVQSRCSGTNQCGNVVRSVSGDVVRSDGGDFVKSDSGDVVRSDGVDVVRSDGVDVVRSDGDDVVKSDGGDVVKSDGDDVVKSDGGDVVKSDGGDVVKSDGDDVVKSDGVKSDGDDVVKSDGGDDSVSEEEASDEENIPRRRRRASVDSDVSDRSDSVAAGAGDGVEGGAGDGEESGAGDSVKGGAGDNVKGGAGDGVEGEAGDRVEGGDGVEGGAGEQDGEFDNEWDETEKTEGNKEEKEVESGPMYVPVKGKFFQHDSRSSDCDNEPVVAEERRTREDKVYCWKHDLFVESEQAPKSRTEKERDARYWNDRDNRRDDGRGGRQGRFVGDRERPQRRGDRRSHDYERKSHDRPERRDRPSVDSGQSEGRYRGQRRSEERSPRQQRDRRNPPTSQSKKDTTNNSSPTVEGSPTDWPTLGEPVDTSTLPQWPIAPSASATSHTTTNKNKQQTNTTTTKSSPKSDKNISSSNTNNEPKGNEQISTKAKSLFNTSRPNPQTVSTSSDVHKSMTFSLSKKHDLVVRTHGKGRGRGLLRDRSKEAVVGKKSHDSYIATNETKHESATNDQTESENLPSSGHQQESPHPTSSHSDQSTPNKEKNQEKFEQRPSEQFEGDPLPQFPAGVVSKPKRYSSRRAKTGGGEEMTENSGFPNYPSTAQPSSVSQPNPPPVSEDGLLPTPSLRVPPESAGQPVMHDVSDPKQQQKLFEQQLMRQQEVMAANPELINYQANVMAQIQQNPMLLQQMQMVWFQQQHAFQQSMMQSGTAAMPSEFMSAALHPSQDSQPHTSHQPHRPATPTAGGDVPQAGQSEKFYSTPGGLFVPDLAQQHQRRLAMQSNKPRSQAIPIVPPEEGQKH